MLNKPDLQVLLATIVVVWSVEAYYQAVIVKEFKFSFVMLSEIFSPDWHFLLVNIILNSIVQEDFF